jgi:hypothetical protein
MLLYADENFSWPVLEELRRRGHNVLTAQDDGHRQTPDAVILARAHALGRVVVTFNRWDYERLDRQGQPHSGILSATPDRDTHDLAARIDAELAGRTPGRWCIRVNKPP